MNHRFRDPGHHRTIDRRNLLKLGAGLGVGALSASWLGWTPARAQDDPASGVKGGTLRVATIGEPPTLDQHQTTAGITMISSNCMFERLYTYDANYQPALELLESHDISEDGLVHTMKLRANVPFHNGEILKSDDAIASVQRWGQISGVGKRLMEATASIDKVDDLTFTWTTSRPYGTIKIALAMNSQACVIYPKSVIDANTLDPIQDGYVGTGPYKLTERQADAYIRFDRFEEYAASPNPTDGYAGMKHAYFDRIEFIPVPDEAARVAGLQAGDYDIALDTGNDQYEVLKDSPGVVAEILRPTNWDVIFLNWKSPLFSNLVLREAVQARLDMKPLLLSGRGAEEFIRLDPGMMMKESPWYTDAGIDRYNMNNPDLAKAKMAEAGYDGTPIRFLTTQEYSYMYGQAIVAKQQLEDVGFVVDLQVTDWATVVQNRAKPEMWDAFITGHGFVPDPSQISYVGQMNIYPGWWDAPDSLDLSKELLAESDFDTRMGIWKQIQANAYTQIPALKTGDSSNCAFYSDRLGGWPVQIESGVPFWNIWAKQ